MSSLDSDRQECLIILMFEILNRPDCQDGQDDCDLLVDTLLEIYFTQNQLKYEIVEGYVFKYSYLLDKYALKNYWAR
jgi:hypothetical protein